MSDHRFNILNNTFGREGSITGNRSVDEFRALDWYSDLLSPVDQQNPDALSSGGPGSTRTGWPCPNDEDVKGFCGLSFIHARTPKLFEGVKD
jgi:hypothetical protein